jgi:phosphonate transport system substrate-binding protein
MSDKAFKVAVLSALLLASISLVAAFASSGPAQGRPVRIGIASMITPVDTVKYYQDIVDYVSQKLGTPAEMIQRRTYAEMDRLLEAGEVDVAFLCSAPYVKDRREFGVELLVAPEVDGKPFYNSYIIVHKDSGIRSLEDLRGKTFAFTDPRSNSGRLYPEYVLARKGFSVDAFFERYVYSYSHNKSIELVAKKVVDGAAVESLVYEYMEKTGSPYTQQTKVVMRSPDFGIPPVVTSRDVSGFLSEKVKEIFLGMHADPKGKAILDAMHIDRFVEVPDSNYDSIREMESFMASLERRDVAVAGEKPDIVRFGVVPRDNPRIAYEKYQPLIDYLSEVTSYSFELVLRKSYEDTVNALGHGEVDIALLGPLAYLEAHKKFGAISILQSVTDKSEPIYRSVVVVRRDSPLSELSELKGKSFAFAAPQSTSGNLYPRYMLAEAGIHLKDLKDYKNFHYHDSVVKWVLNGEYDAGAIRETVAEKYLPAKLRVIGTSGPIPTGPVVIGPKTTYAVAESVKRALLALGRTEAGKGVLEKLDPELRRGFVQAEDHIYEGVRRMINDVPKTCGIGCHPKIEL